MHTIRTRQHSGVARRAHSRARARALIRQRPAHRLQPPRPHPRLHALGSPTTPALHATASAGPGSRQEVWRPRLQRVGRLTWRDTTRAVLAGYGRHGGDGLATMIAFNATVSLVPFLLTLFTMLSLLVQNEGVHTRLREGVADVLPLTVSDVVLRVVDQGRENLSQLSLVTLVALFLGGSRFLTALDGAFSRIYGVQQRPYLERKIVFTLVVPLVGLLLIGAAAAATIANLLLAQPDRMLASAERQWWSGIISLFGSFLAAYVLLWVIYATIPNYHASPFRRFRAWPGALVSGLLFVVLTQVFPIYLRFFGGSIAVAGAMALALLLLLWMYLLGQLLVIGAEVNALASGAGTAVAGLLNLPTPPPARADVSPAPAPVPGPVPIVVEVAATPLGDCHAPTVDDTAATRTPATPDAPATAAPTPPAT